MTAQEWLRLRRPFNWGLLIVGDPAAQQVPELTREGGINHSSELIVVPVRHAQDVGGADSAPFEVEITCRERAAGFGGDGYAALIQLHSGDLSIGDADDESIVHMQPAWWWITITLTPSVHAEAVEIEVSHAEACPVCRWPGLMEEAWREHSPSHEICPSCGTEFGYDDAIGLTDRDALAARHSSLRQSWERGGREWWSDSRKAPAGWQARRP